MTKKILRSLLRMALAILGIAIIGSVLLYFAQDKLLFYPRSYGSDVSKIRESYEKLEFTSEKNGQQTAYYIGPKDPEKLWVLTGGNGSLALGWDLLTAPAARKNPRNGYLLIEYPGYGENEGKPSRTAISENLDLSIEALATFLRTEVSTLKNQTSFLGHSLGAAIALETAARWERPEIIALSPFTSIKAMAAKMVGGPLSNVARNRWDNVESLTKLTTVDSTKVLIIHGTRDEIIPVSMGRELSETFPTITTFIEEEGAQHNNLMWEIRDQLVSQISR